MRYLLQEKIGQQPSSDIATTGWKPKSHAVLLIMQVFISHSATDSRDKVSQSIPSSSVTCRQSLKRNTLLPLLGSSVLHFGIDTGDCLV